MIHQPLGGAQGQAADIEIQAKEILFVKTLLNSYMYEQCTILPLPSLSLSSALYFSFVVCLRWMCVPVFAGTGAWRPHIFEPGGVDKKPDLAKRVRTSPQAPAVSSSVDSWRVGPEIRRTSGMIGCSICDSLS